MSWEKLTAHSQTTMHTWKRNACAQARRQTSMRERWQKGLNQHAKISNIAWKQLSLVVVASSQMAGLSTSDKTDKEGCIYIPCSLSEGSRRSIGLSCLQEGKEKTGLEDLFCKKYSVSCNWDEKINWIIIKEHLWEVPTLKNRFINPKNVGTTDSKA